MEARIKETNNVQTPGEIRPILTNQEQWMGLCELVSNEQDQDKLGALFEGFLRLLEDQQQERLHAAADGLSDGTPALISH